MKCIAFSLYGSDPRYLVGTVENARMARSFYPGWQVHVWTDHQNTRVTRQLHGWDVRVHLGPRTGLFNGMFWRFLIHDLPGVERYIVRDVDSRFSRREVEAVNEWIKAGTQLHVMRDHPWHNQPMMGGLWGWLKDPEHDFHMSTICRQGAEVVGYGKDQEFLARTVWKFARSGTVHDSCGAFDGRVTWPADGPGFVGEYVSATGKPNETHRRIRSEFLAKGALQPA